MATSDNLEDTGERLISEGNEQTLTYGEHLSRYYSVRNMVVDKVVLDVACGTGYGAKIIAQNAKSVTGIDYSKPAIAYSKRHNNAGNIAYVVGDAHAMPFEDATFDVIVSFETIEHLPDPEKFIKEVKRILKPTGVFVVSTPNDDEFMEGNEFHVHEFHLGELRRLIEQHFRHSRFYYQGTFFSAALLPEDLFVNGGMWEGLTHKSFKQKKSKAIFFIAAASDKPLADAALTKNVALADVWSTKDDMERDQARQKAIANLVEKVETAQRSTSEIVAKYEDLKTNRNQLQQTLTRIYNSRSWKLARVIRAPAHFFRKFTAGGQ